MTTAQQTARIVRSLPPAKASAVLDYARYLAEKTDDESWDAATRKVGKSRKFRALAAKVERDIARGKAEPMDLRRL